MDIEERLPIEYVKSSGYYDQLRTWAIHLVNVHLDGYLNELVIKTLPTHVERQVVGQSLMFIGGIMLMYFLYLWWQIMDGNPIHIYSRTN